MFRSFIRTVDRTLALIEDWSLFLAVSAALIVAMANILLRKTTDINIFWSDEVVRKVIFFTTFMGAAAALRARSLIRIDALPQLIPVLRKPLNAVSHLGVLTFASLMIWLGSQITLMVYHDPYARTATLQIPEWYFYAVLPLIGVMMFLRTLIIAFEDLTGRKLTETK
jgi:C4-dicarboxylate transporter, DctQ subunit